MLNYKRVCFVCTANMIRSIMAESILRKLRPEIEVFSCGILAIDGLKPKKETIVVLDEKKYNPTINLSKSINNCVFDSTLIICMTKLHKKELKVRLPDSEIYTLKELNSRKEEDIIDPVNLGIEAYRKTLNDIEKEIISYFCG